MESCLFCKIVAGEIPANFVYQDKDVVAFRDIHPKGRVHLLIVPTTHVKSFLDLSGKQISLLTKMAKVIQSLIKTEKIESSYYTQISGGARQEVPHLHWHLIGD